MTPYNNSGQSSQNAFVGRDRELGELRGALDDVSAGHGRLFLLSGEPGIGKTRLSEEISKQAAARGMRAVWGRCWEGGGAPAYWPLIQILRVCLHDRDGEQLRALLGSNADEITRLIPELKLSLPALESTDITTDSESARFLLFDSVATLLKNLARERPLLVVVDDLQDADQPSLQMLRFVARAAKDVALLIIGTYRDSEVKRSPQLGKLVGDLLREGHSLPLTGLSKAEVGDLIASRTGRAEDEGLVADLYRATDGNALYVEGVLRLLESGEKAERAATDRNSFKIPDGVRESIRRRLAELSVEVNSLLSIACVIGTEFETRLLERVSRISPELIVDRMEEAARIGILSSSTSTGYTQYRFSHALIREVLYDELPAKKRIESHTEIATAIEELHKGDLKPHWAELARHYAEAGIGEKAIDCWIKAGETAYSVFGFEESASCWRAALAMIEQQGAGSDVRARVHERLGDPILARGPGSSEAVAHLEAALRAYRDLGDVQHEARVHIRLGHLMSTNFDAMDIPAALAHFRKAEAVIDQVPERESLGLLYSGFGSAAREAMQTKEGLRTSRRAMQIAERLGAEALWIDAAALHSDLLLNAGQIKEALALTEETYLKADLLNEAGAACIAAVIYGGNYIHLLDPNQAESCFLRELGKPRLNHAAQARDILLVRLEMAHLLRGELGASDRPRIQGRTDSFAEGRQRLFSGEWEIAGSAISRSLKYSRRVGSCDATAQLLVYAARICRLRGHLEEGVTHLRESLNLCGDDLNWLCEIQVRPELGLSLVEAESLEEAQLHLARCREIIAAGEDWRGLAGVVFRSEGALAAAEKRYEQAEIQFQNATEIFRRYHVPFEEAETLYCWGRTLNASGESGRQNEKLDAAIAIYRRCGAGERWIERVEALRAPASALRPLRSDSFERLASPAQNEGVLRREGDYWTVAYEGKTWRLKDAKGLHYIAYLLAHPGEEIRVLDLVSRIDGAGVEVVDDAGAEDLARSGALAGDLGHAGEMLDEQAKAEYRRRLQEVEDELEEAREFRNDELIAKAEEEKEAITHELRRAIGLAGRDRRAASSTERARVAVTRAIRLALERISKQDRSLGKILSTTIKTGAVCSYTPDERFPVSWQL